MDTLNATQPFYIRCIRPNTLMRPHEFDAPYVNDQLRCGGVLEATRIASAGFPTRRSFDTIVERYGIVSDPGRRPEAGAGGAAKRIAAIMKDADVSVQSYRIGKTRVFMRSGALARLEAARGRARNRAATVIQAHVRGSLARDEAARRRRSIVVIQRCWRRYAARKRARQANKSFLRRNAAAKTVQRLWKQSRRRKTAKQKQREMEERRARDEEARRQQQQQQQQQQAAAARQPVALSSIENVGVLVDPMYQRISLLQEMLMRISSVNALDVTHDSVLELAEACGRDKVYLSREIRFNRAIASNQRAYAEALALNDRLGLILALYDKKLQHLNSIPLTTSTAQYTPAPLRPPPPRY